MMGLCSTLGYAVYCMAFGRLYTYLFLNISVEMKTGMNSMM